MDLTFFLVLCAIAAFIATLWRLSQVIQTAAAIQSTEPLRKRGKPTAKHRQSVDKFILHLLIFVAFVRAATWDMDGIWERDVLFYLHLGAVVIFSIELFCMRVLYNGIKWPKVHANLSYSLFAFGITIFVTGTLLVIRALLK